MEGLGFYILLLLIWKIFPFKKKNQKIIFLVYTRLYILLKLMVNISNKISKKKQLFKTAHANSSLKHFQTVYRGIW